MPYVDKKTRQYLEPGLKPLLEDIKAAANLKDDPERAIPGILTYIIACLLINYYHASDFHDHALADGILGAAAKEFYRRSTAVLEDKKIKENGDVFSPTLRVNL